MTGGHRLELKRYFCFDPCSFSVACWPHRLSGTVRTAMPQSCRQSRRHSNSGGLHACMSLKKKKEHFWFKFVKLHGVFYGHSSLQAGWPGMASVCVCDWSHMFNSCWTMHPIPLFIDWKLILLRASFMLHCMRVNSIVRHHGLVIALHCPRWFLYVGCLLLPVFTLTSPEICCSVIKKTPIHHLQMLYCPEDHLRWVYFMQCNRHISPIPKSKIPHMLLLGIGPCVSPCVRPAICISWCGFALCLASILPNHLTLTLSHTLLGAEGAPFITVTFSFNTQPKSSCIDIHVSCAPHWGTIPAT